MMRLFACALAWLIAAGCGQATAIDVGQRMADTAQASALVRSAVARVHAGATGLRDPGLRHATLAALFDPADCVRHRIGMGAARQVAIIQALRAHGWINPARDDSTVRVGIFPPLRDAETDCPRLPAPDLLAAGGDGVSHHSWPGGLALHVAFNIASARAQIRLYARQSRSTGLDTDRIVAAALWHDWAKALTLQWQPDGILTPEVQIAGTGAHHILGLAEAMRRGLPPAQIVVQACAHGTDINQLTAWIGAAALVAGTDATHYPIVISPDCIIHHLSDQNWVFADAAVTAADRMLLLDAARYGFARTNRARYRLCYRNPALSALGADRLFVGSRRTDEQMLDRIFLHRGACQ